MIDEDISKESTSDEVLRAFWSDYLQANDKFMRYKEFKRKVLNDDLAIDMDREDFIDEQTSEE